MTNSNTARAFRPFWPAGDEYRVAYRGSDFVEPSGGNVGEQGGYGAARDTCIYRVGSHTQGTAVASVAAGLTYGVAKHTDILPIRVVSCDGATNLQRVIGAIDELVAEAATGQTAVATFSFYFDSISGQSALDSAIDSLIDRNIGLCAISGG